MATSSSPMEGSVDIDTGETLEQYKARIAAENGTSNEAYKTKYWRYMCAMGCPPAFNINVDPQYMDEFGPGIGREFARSLLSNPTILSICPGKVDYLPGFTNSEQDAFATQVLSMASSNSALNGKLFGGGSDAPDALNGKLYTFKAAYNEYITNVNYLCRMCSLLLGIGDDLMPRSSTPYKKFDYAWWTEPSKPVSTDEGQNPSIFATAIGNFKKSLTTAVSDADYIHFFVTHQGTSHDESIETSTMASMLESAINDSSLSSMARNLEFLFGTAIGSNDTFNQDLDRLLNDPGQTGSDFLRSFARLGKNYMKGGRLVFPQMIDDVAYNDRFSATLKFISPYGEKHSIFLRCLVPIMHLLALALPKQIADNMYTYPFLVRAFQQGWFNTDLAVITNMRITRGGEDDICWTIDALPTEFEVSFDITPLYSSQMVSNTSHPFLAMRNTALTEYLGTLCSVDLKANNLQAKLKIAESMIFNRFTDVPAQLGRRVLDTNVMTMAQSLFQIVNK